MRRRRRKGRSLAARTWSIYRHQRERAQAMGAKVPYGLAVLRALVNTQLGEGACPYCLGPLRPENLNIDHQTPVSRGGGWEPSNLAACCRRCNEAKGALTREEWSALNELLGGWPVEARRDMLARLRAGGRRRGGR